ARRDLDGPGPEDRGGAVRHRRRRRQERRGHPARGAIRRDGALGRRLCSGDGPGTDQDGRRTEGRRARAAQRVLRGRIVKVAAKIVCVGALVVLGFALSAWPAQAQLGGVSLSAQGFGVQMTYNEPQAPVPPPTWQTELAYSEAEFTTGPSSH